MRSWGPGATGEQVVEQEMDVALLPTVVELLAEAERQERQKRLAEQWEFDRRRMPM